MTSDVPASAVEPIVDDEFEGEPVKVMRGRIPSISMEMPAGFARNTHLDLKMRFRVRNVRYEESTDKDHRGELERVHMFVLEEHSPVEMLGALTAEEADPGVGGSAGRLEERDDFDLVVQDCYYDVTELTVVHRGSCDLCYRRVPEEVLLRTMGKKDDDADGVDPEAGF